MSNNNITSSASSVETTSTEQLMNVCRTVTRIGYATKDITIQVPVASTEADISHAVIEAAGNHQFSEHDADYVETSKIGETENAALRLLQLLRALSHVGFGTEIAINAADAVEKVHEAYTQTIEALSGTPFEPSVFYSKGEDGYWSNDFGWGGIEFATHFYPRVEDINPPQIGTNDSVMMTFSDAVNQDLQAQKIKAEAFRREKAKEPVMTTVTGFNFKTRAGDIKGSINGLLSFTPSTAKTTITRAEYIMDIGWTFSGVSADERLSGFLEIVACPEDKSIHFNRLQLDRPSDAMTLAVLLADSVGVVRTTDGYTFRRGEDGKWSDGDMSCDSLHSLMNVADLVIETPQAKTID